MHFRSAAPPQSYYQVLYKLTILLSQEKIDCDIALGDVLGDHMLGGSRGIGHDLGLQSQVGSSAKLLSHVYVAPPQSYYHVFTLMRVGRFTF